jgi:hypothetical protein
MKEAEAWIILCSLVLLVLMVLAAFGSWFVRQWKG